MKYLIILISLVVVSCASVQEYKITELTIDRKSNYDMLRIINNFKVYENLVNYYIEYENIGFTVKKPFPVKVSTGDIEKTYYLKLQNYTVQVKESNEKIFIKILSKN